MDRKSIIVLAVCFVLLLTWTPLVNRLYPPKPMPARTNLTAAAAAPTATNTAPVLGPAPAPLPAVTPPPVLVRSTTPESLVELENGVAHYTFTTHGGGLKLVELKKYPESIAPLKAPRRLTNHLAALNPQAAFPVLSVLGTESVQGDGVFELIKTTGGVRAEKRLTNGLFLVKEFQVSSNYLLQASVRFENRSTQALVLPRQECTAGTATPMNPNDEGLLMGMMWYNGLKAETIGDAWFANRTLGCLPGTPRSVFVGGDGVSNVVWTAVYNQFFALALIPEKGAPQLMAHRVDLPPPTPAERAANRKAVERPFGFQAALLYPGLTLAPRETVERRYLIYAGPKEYNTLAKLGVQMGNNVDLVMDFGGFFGFFAKALLLSMNGLNALGLGYGLAIIAITVIVKLVFWPLTTASTRSMKRMSALQPQMKAIQAKYKDDPKKMNAKMMEFMKENKVNPMSGCFPMLLQIPVFFGFYKMLQCAIELRGARFLWAADLSSPDTIYTLWLGPSYGFPINPLPLLMGATMLWQSHLTPPSPSMDPMQQKLMKYMPLMFIFFLYNFSAGLSLYWTVLNLLTIAQMKLTKTEPAPAAPGSKAPLSLLKRFGAGKKRK